MKAKGNTSATTTSPNNPEDPKTGSVGSSTGGSIGGSRAQHGATEHRPIKRPASYEKGMLTKALNSYRGNRANASIPMGVMRWFLLLLLVFALYLSFVLIRPFMDTFILGIVLAAIFHPVYSWIKNKMRGPESLREAVASICVVLGMLVLIGLPIFLFLRGVIPQATQSVNSITQLLGSVDFEQKIQAYWEPFVQYVKTEYPPIDLSAIDLHKNLLDFSRQIGQTLLQLGSSLFRNTTIFIIQLLLLLFIVFFLLKDGARMIAGIKYLCPIREEQGDSILHNMRKVSRSVLLGGFFVASLQGLAGGISLAVVGIPALFWGTVLAFVAMIPVVGTGLVWIPATIYLLLTGPWWIAVVFAIYNTVVVGSIDTFLRPILMRDGANAPVFFIFLSILGGVSVFGMLGLLYGPMILTFTAVMLNIYADEFKDLLNPEEAPAAPEVGLATNENKVESN